MVTARSASRLSVVVTTAESSLVEIGSVGDWAPRWAWFVIEVAVELGLIWARIRTVFDSPEESAPTGVDPVQELPVLGSQVVGVSTQHVAVGSSPDKLSLRVAEVPSEGP